MLELWSISRRINSNFLLLMLIDLAVFQSWRLEPAILNIAQSRGKPFRSTPMLRIFSGRVSPLLNTEVPLVS